MTPNYRRSIRRRWVSLFALTMTLGLITTLGPAGLAQSQSVSTSTLTEAGALRLRTGAQDHFRFEPTSGPAKTQTWTSPGCKVKLAASPKLVALSSTPAGSFPGFFDDALGVGSKAEGNGQPCGRIDAGQALSVKFDTGLSGTVGDYAELDIEAKFGATILVELWLNVGSTRTMTGSRSVPTGGVSDSGPDSGDQDNFRVRVPKNGTALFNEIVVTTNTPGGAVSLEGGADGTPACNAITDPGSDCETFSLGETIDDPPASNTTTDSLIHLLEVDGFLDCGQTAPTQGGSGTPTNSLERLPNASGTCAPIPFSLDSSVVENQQFIVLRKNLLGQDARFYWTATWVPEPGEYQESETQFDFGNGFQPLQQCLGDADDDGFPELPPTADETDPADATDPWCVVSTSATLDVSTGLTTVAEKYFGRGDPTGKR